MLLFIAALLPQAATPLLLAALLLILAERWRLRRQIAALARQLAAGNLSRKLEVPEGALEELCHAINGQLQQRRVQDRALALLPELPDQVHRQQIDDPAALERGRTVPLATVLLVGFAGQRSYDALQAQTAAWRVLAEAAQQQARQHGALMQLRGDALLLIFGLFEQQSRAAGLRAAMATAQALRRHWRTAGLMGRGGLSLSIASGSVVAGVLPGLGYNAFGPAIEQALHLQHLAAACPEYALLCSEEAYATLRHIVGTPASSTPRTGEWLHTDLRLLQPGQPPQAVYALPV